MNSRRRFLKMTWMAAAAATGTGLRQAAAALPTGAVVVIPERCMGCEACVIACNTGRCLPRERWDTVVERHVEGRYPRVRKKFFPRMCRHCANAPCVQACPSGAMRTEAGGVVVVDRTACIGCGSCVEACPHGAVVLHQGKAAKCDPKSIWPHCGTLNVVLHQGKAAKCDLCHDRLAAGMKPRCVETCPSQARLFEKSGTPIAAVHDLPATKSGGALVIYTDRGE